MLRYAITSRVRLAETEAERSQRLISIAENWSANRIDFIQIREKDLAPVDLTQLAAAIVRAVRENGAHSKILINAGPVTALKVAIESGADGVHLPSGLNPGQLAATIAQIHEAWRTRREPAAPPPISVSCHSTADILAARAAGATLALFAPVFEKQLPVAPALAGQGLHSLARACQAANQPSPYPKLPVLALGGVTRENTPQCVAAGAAGIAAIRLFLQAGL